MPENKKKVINILSGILNTNTQLLSDIGDDESLRDYGLNSVRGIELIVRIEEEYEIEIADMDLNIESYDTITKAVELVEKYTKV